MSYFNVEQSRNGPNLHFRLNNRNISLTYVKFCKLFYLEPQLPTAWHENYELEDIYSILTGLSTPNAQHASALPFHHPVPKIFQRFSGTCFLARHEPHNAQTNELDVIGHYVFGYGKLNIGRYIIHHWSRHATTST